MNNDKNLGIKELINALNALNELNRELESKKNEIVNSLKGNDLETFNKLLNELEKNKKSFFSELDINKIINSTNNDYDIK